jgi:hypothetical protein
MPERKLIVTWRASSAEYVAGGTPLSIRQEFYEGPLVQRIDLDGSSRRGQKKLIFRRSYRAKRECHRCGPGSAQELPSAINQRLSLYKMPGEGPLWTWRSWSSGIRIQRAAAGGAGVQDHAVYQMPIRRRACCNATSRRLAPSDQRPPGDEQRPCKRALLRLTPRPPYAVHRARRNRGFRRPACR